MDVEVLSGLKKLAYLGFYQCKSLKNLNGLHGLSHLHDLSFFQCVSLTDLNGLRGLKSLASIYFERCESLTEEHVDGLRRALPECKISDERVRRKVLLRDADAESSDQQDIPD